MVRRTEAGISMVMVRTVVGLGLIGVPSVLGSGCDGSSKCDCETCESTGGTSASAGAANAESPEGGETARPEGIGGQASVGGGSSSTEGGESGGATSTASGGNASSSGSATGALVVQESELGTRCLDPSIVACIAGRPRERARCGAETASWGLHEACPEGTECHAPTAGCAPVRDCAGHAAGERYCASAFEVSECGADGVEHLVELCAGHCAQGVCDAPEVSTCATVPEWETLTCGCGCTDAAGNCVEYESEGSCEVGFEVDFDVSPGARFSLIGPLQYYSGFYACSATDDAGWMHWSILGAKGWVRAMTSEGAGVELSSNTEEEECAASSARCVVAWQPELVRLWMTPDTTYPSVVMVEEVESEDSCP